MHELNEQNIQYLTALNINIHKMLLSNIIIEKSNLSYGYYFGCVLSNISCFESDLSNTIFSNGEINNLFIKKSNIFGTSFTNTRIKNLRCEDIMSGRWTTQLVNKHLGYRYTGVFKTLASIDDKPSRFEILIPLVQTLVRDNVKLNNDVYKELKKFMHDYDKTSPEMNAAGKTNCKVIVMTGSPQILAGFRLPKNGHAIDLMDRCVRVEPKHVLLADKAEVMEDMQQRLAAGEKVIYFANRVSTVLNLYRNAFQEYRNEAAVSFSADDELDKQEKENREILERRDEIQAYIAENQKLPDDIRLFLTTSKNKEGINIKNADIKTMYIETHSQIDAIQMAGRVRAGLDQLYIVTDAVQNSAPESPFEYELSGRTDLQASLNAHLAQKKEDAGIAEEAPWSVQEHEGIRNYIAYIQKKFPYFCYDYFADAFCLYSDRHSSRRYYAEQNAAFVRAKEEGNLLSLVRKWFPQADIAYANKKQQRIDAYFHAQDILNVPLEKSTVQEIKAYLEIVIGQPFRCFNHFMKPYGYAIRKASGNTTSPNYGKQIITRIGTGKT